MCIQRMTTEMPTIFRDAGLDNLTLEFFLSCFVITPMTLSFWRSQQSTRYNFARVTRRGFFGPLQIAFEEQGLFWKYIIDNTV